MGKEKKRRKKEKKREERKSDFRKKIDWERRLKFHWDSVTVSRKRKPIEWTWSWRWAILRVVQHSDFACQNPPSPFSFYLGGGEGLMMIDIPCTLVAKNKTTPNSDTLNIKKGPYHFYGILGSKRYTTSYKQTQVSSLAKGVVIMEQQERVQIEDVRVRERPCDSCVRVSPSDHWLHCPSLLVGLSSLEDKLSQG